MGHSFWPSPIAYRLAEFSMLAYPDPSHHSAASDLVACRDRSIVLAGFAGDNKEGTQAEWCDRLVGFVHLAAFVRTKRRGWFGRRVLRRPEWRSFFASEAVLTLLAGGDHFVAELAAMADDHEEVEEVTDALVDGRYKGREVDLYVSDVVIPEKDTLAQFWQRVAALKKTPGMRGLAAILVPAKSLIYHDAAFNKRLERRAKLMNMERIAVCPAKNDEEKKTPQEFWLSKEIHARHTQRWYARMKVWLQEHSSACAVLILIAFLAGKVLDQTMEAIVEHVGNLLTH
ncbi:MAG: hypothetical protein JW809_07735 [Pirellulales bacterium]|nr:hypothetical protein [Pirellulales bacterium]